MVVNARLAPYLFRVVVYLRFEIIHTRGVAELLLHMLDEVLAKEILTLYEALLG